MSLTDRVADLKWYHTIDLPGGVVTPGEYDLRSAVPQMPLPSSLVGKRCLDIGTRDGFWAFEMERRGASEVIGIDIDNAEMFDWPLPRPEISQEVRKYYEENAAFHLAKEALGSRVIRRGLSVYELQPDDVGYFDFAMIGTLLHHLRDPVGALMSVRRVLTGHLVVAGAVSWA